MFLYSRGFPSIFYIYFVRINYFVLCVYRSITSSNILYIDILEKTFVLISTRKQTIPYL